MLALAVCVVAAAAVPAVASSHHKHKRNHRISGTVASFHKGALAIKKANGTVVTGDVTGQTDIQCENQDNGDVNDQNDANENDTNSAQDSRVARAAHDGGGDEGDNPAQGTTGPQQPNQADDDQNEVDDQNETDNEDQNTGCGTAQLTPGTVVASAATRGRHNHKVWKNLKVAR
jgi:hypothetical protein